MKKFVLPIILAAVLGICGGAIAVMINRANMASANYEQAPHELQSGKYYLNGDKNADLWIEVNPDFLILKGTDVDKSLKDGIASKLHDLDPGTSVDEATATVMQNEFEETKTLYCTEKIYVVSTFIPEKSLDLINVSRFNNESTPEELLKSNAAFVYNYAEKSIQLSLFGDFILVE